MEDWVFDEFCYSLWKFEFDILTKIKKHNVNCKLPVSSVSSISNQKKNFLKFEKNI